MELYRAFIMKIPLRQKLASWFQRLNTVDILGVAIENWYTLKLIPFIAGKEPWYWIHYGKDCICCKRGWHI